MIIFDESRASDSPLVEQIWSCHSEGTHQFLSVAAIQCELVISRLQGKINVSLRGPETRATAVGDCPTDGEWLGIIFKLGTFLPKLPTDALVGSEMHLPVVGKDSFWLFGSTWQLPTYENADIFVDRLRRQGLMVREPLVTGVLQGDPNYCSQSTVQRRFLRSTGLTQGTARQIERARHATRLLQQGVSILDAVTEAGYFDQSHLTRSLKRFIGQTPTQILEKNRPEQMPFLYKTETFR